MSNEVLSQISNLYRPSLLSTVHLPEFASEGVCCHFFPYIILVLKKVSKKVLNPLEGVHTLLKKIWYVKCMRK